jgi:ATP-dependent helicase/nuclease subunit B
MLTVITGEPHPDLGAALRSSLREWRARSEFSRAVLVAPSNEMRRDLRLLIARDWGEAFVGLELVTAQGFARMILGGAGGRETADAAILEASVRELLRSGDFPRLGGLAETAGGPAALLETLLDLTESCLPAEAIPRSEPDEVLRLYAAFDRARRDAKLVMHTDIVYDAAEAAADPDALRRLSEVFYFGFYDMTGVQEKLLASVTRAARVTFFLPLGEGPAYEFARTFFGEVLKPLADRVEQAAPAEGGRPLVEPVLAGLFRPMVEGAGETPKLRRKPRLVSVSGTEAELEVAAREVLRLVEEEGLGWGEVAVVARSLAPYVPHVESVFGERLIPFRSSAKLPAGRFPVTKAVAAFVRVLRDGMRRADVIDLVSSPFFARAPEGRAGGWDLLTRQLRIVGGETQWAKLKPLAEKGATTVRGEDEEDTHVDAGVARDLWRCVDPLIDMCATFPEEGTWEKLAAAFEFAFDRFLKRPADDTDSGEACAFEGLRGVVRDMHGFGAISERTTRVEFLAALAGRLDEVAVPLGDDRADAVEILDAMAARCRSFRAVVLVGMAGGLFPRAIEENAFLPDQMRAALARRHSVRLTPKRAGFDEERLLFHLMLASARERLTLVHQRSDDEGKPLVPSWYLEELRRAAGGAEAFEEVRVPRLFADHLRRLAREGAAALAYLTPREWREGLVIDGDRDRKLWDAVSRDGALLERALAAADDLERPAPTLGPRDGITGPLPRFFERMSARGFSPTGLQTYAECPFKFLASKVLGLEEPEEAERALEPGPLDMGWVFHRMLEVFFKKLVRADRFTGRGAKVKADALLAESAHETFNEAEREVTTGSPLIWERVKSDLVDLARLYVRSEVERLEEEGWTPVAFEVKDVACISDSAAFPENVRGLKLYGRIDRLDRRDAGGRVEARVVDYKFKTSGSRKSEENDLARGAVRGRRLQPAVYLLMARDLVAEAEDARAEFHFIAPNWADGPVVVRDLPPDCWSTDLGCQVAGTISALVGGMARGEWFVAPARHCDYCDFITICRKSHSRTRYRLAADARPRSLAEIARRDPAGDGPRKKAAKKGKKAKKRPASGGKPAVRAAKMTKKKRKGGK